MALVIADRVKESTTTTGTGALSLGGADLNFATFSSVLSDGDTTYYSIVDDSNEDWEVGLGTYAVSGNTLTRTTVYSSSNSGSVVDLGSGSKIVFITYPANQSIYKDASDVLTTGSIVATSIAKSGGTSSQFLKADGSVDLNTYLTESTADALYEPLIAEANRQTFYRQASQPTGGTYREGDMWYQTTTETLYFYREVSLNVFNWIPLATGTDDSDTLDGGAY